MVYDQPISPYYFLARLGIVDLAIKDQNFYVQINTQFYNLAFKKGSVREAMLECGAHGCDVTRFTTLIEGLIKVKMVEEKTSA